MASGRRTKVLASALAVFVVFVFIFHSHSTYDWSDTSAGSIVTEKSLFDSQNNEVVDDAINREISKEKSKEETGGGAEAADSGDVDAGDFDPSKAFLQIRSLAPMTIFSKTYCPYSKKLKKLLKENYSITPEPQIVELDKHKHGQELQEYVGRVSERSTVPNVIVGTASVLSKGGADEFIALHQEGKLVEMLNLWGGKAISVSRLEVPSNS
ncbi:hypothetical protein JCM33374_g2719 [Metschnikowia sp. JCM 33374]|nr:hypothetical protein JCM33374_g2719 [Metschnikowia sp. JCM 33374]